MSMSSPLENSISDLSMYDDRGDATVGALLPRYAISVGRRTGESAVEYAWMLPV